jgi:hypothetical protein
LSSNTVGYDDIPQNIPLLRTLPSLEINGEIFYWRADIEKAIAQSQQDVSRQSLKDKTKELNAFIKDCIKHEEFEERIQRYQVKAYLKSRQKYKSSLNSAEQNLKRKAKLLHEFDDEHGRFFECCFEYCRKAMTVFEAMEHQHFEVFPDIPSFSWLVKEYDEISFYRIEQEMLQIARSDIREMLQTNNELKQEEIRRLVHLLKTAQHSKIYRCLMCPNPFENTYTVKGIHSHLKRHHGRDLELRFVFPNFGF